MSGCPERFPQAPKSINQKFYQHKLFLNLSGWLAQKPKPHEWLRAGSWVDNESIMSNSRVACLTNEHMLKSPAQVRPFPETSWGNMKSNRHCIRPAFMSVQWKLFMSKRGFIVHEWTVQKTQRASIGRKNVHEWLQFREKLSWAAQGIFFLSWVATARVFPANVHVSRQ